MPAILRRRKLISLRPEKKSRDIRIPYKKEQVQIKPVTPPSVKKAGETEKPSIICPSCKQQIDRTEVEKNRYVCYQCGNYFRVRTKNRIRMVADAGTFEPWFEYLEDENPLEFPEYEEKLEAVREKTGLHEAVTVGKCKIYGEETVLGICDARFLMSSMGHVVG